MSFRSYDLLKLVEDFGESLTLVKTSTDGTYDPTTGTISGKATTDYSVTGYFYNYEVMTADQIRKGSRKCLLPANGLAVEPDDNDTITGNGDTVVIESVTTIFSDGNAICYICHVSE